MIAWWESGREGRSACGKAVVLKRTFACVSWILVWVVAMISGKNPVCALGYRNPEGNWGCRNSLRKQLTHLGPTPFDSARKVESTTYPFGTFWARVDFYTCTKTRTLRLCQKRADHHSQKQVQPTIPALSCDDTYIGRKPKAVATTYLKRSGEFCFSLYFWGDYMQIFWAEKSAI